MFFDRDQNIKRQREQAYRNQLKQQIQLKNSRTIAKPQRSNKDRQEAFSLLKNIQIQSENRKNKKQNYYAELRNQIQFQRKQKQRKKEEEARRQLEEEEKIRRDNEMLRQRAEMEMMKQKNKKVPPQQDTNINKSNDHPKPANRIKIQQNQNNLQQNFNSIQKYSNQNIQKDYYSRLKTSQSQAENNQIPNEITQGSTSKAPYSMSKMPFYTNRIENQSFNFLPQRKYMDSYFQELLGEKRRFQQEALGISELNKLLYQQKTKIGKIQSRGLNELKRLQGMLDEKGENYMLSFGNIKNYSQYDQYNQYDSLKKLTVPSFQNSRISESGWKKLD